MIPRDGFGMNMGNHNNPPYSPYWLMHNSVLDEQSTKMQKIIEGQEKLVKEVEDLKIRT
jgi:hypothetical protein